MQNMHSVCLLVVRLFFVLFNFNFAFYEPKNLKPKARTDNAKSVDNSTCTEFILN